MASHLIWLILCFISSLICGVAAILFHLKPRRTSSSSSTATCPPDSAPPSSSSVDHPEIKYDVFLSFRGTDTRSGFLSHLLEELSRKKIDYFVDDQKLKQGDEISSTLLTAIKMSEISLVVFSKDYADSKWCLEELEQIIQCKENQNQIVLPIFYNVDPSTVRHQKGSYKKAFDRLGKRFDKHKLQKWQTALKKTSDISGFDSSSYNTEATLIKEVVERVLVALNLTKERNDLKGFVGLHKHIQYLETRLHMESRDVLTIGIWGMGGIGKTTIAEILYNRLYNKYEGRCLLRVKEELEKGSSKSDLKKKLLSKLLDEDVHDVTLNGSPTYVERRLHRKKVLVVLDDINDSDQLEILIGGDVQFGSGSRVIVTSRDKHVFSKECDEIYLVYPLNFGEALQLFENGLTKDCLVKKEERSELSKEVVNYTQCVPLAIKVLARFLCDRNKDEWKSKLEKLEKMPDSKIQNVLELSYNGLDDCEHKEIFLDLACFFRNGEKKQITMLLDACGYHTIDGLKALQDKALITISNSDVCMHDLIRAMGCEIVRKKSPRDLGQRTHLLNVDDIYKVFKNRMGTGTIESIRLEIWKLKRDLHLGPQAFSKMNNIRLLKFDGKSENSYMVYPHEEGFDSLPDELRYFGWSQYPSKSFPLRFCVENLVELCFEDSKLQRLWDRVQDLPNLRVLNFSSSSELIELPDLSKAPNLEEVDLSDCHLLGHSLLWPKHNMVERDSIKCEERKKVSVGRRVSLTSLSTEASKEDDHLDLCGMSLPIIPSIKHYVLPSLQWLWLAGCGITELPENIGLYLPSLETLNLSETMVETLPKSIKLLSQLRSLELSHCSRLWYIPELPPSIRRLDAPHCKLLEKIQFSWTHQKHELYIDLKNSVKLDDHQLKAVARHYILTTQRIISASIRDVFAHLYIPVPKWFSNYRETQDSVLAPFELPLHSRAMGFIFYFVIIVPDDTALFYHELEMKCHIELSNVAKVQFICDGIKPYDAPIGLSSSRISDQVMFWYGSRLGPKIIEEVHRIKASVTTNDLCAKVWFELLEMKFKWFSIKEWGCIPFLISCESQDLTNKICSDINDSDEDDNDDFPMICHSSYEASSVLQYLKNC